MTAELADAQARLLVQQLYAGSKRRPDMGEPLRIPRPKPEGIEAQAEPEPQAPELSSRDEMLTFFGKTDPTGGDG